MKTSKDSVSALIGVGASAGGLEPIQRLLANMPDHMANAAMIVAQHMSPNYDSKLVELLKRKTSLQVLEARNGDLLKPNCIYVIPPDSNVEVKNSAIYLSKSREAGPKPSIDRLFHSISLHNGDVKKMGVILSGTGSDGTDGIGAISDAGGVAIAQDPATAKYGGMPYSAISAGKVHCILEAGAIGQNLVALVENPDAAERIRKETSEDRQTDNKMDRVIDALSSRIGINFSGYKTSTMYRRLVKRMFDCRYTDVDSYLEHITKNPEELDILFQTMLIGVTEFFRDPAAFDEVGKIVREKLAKPREVSMIRIWVAGCATGEEAYTLAIIVHEALKQHNSYIEVQIFATDIDEKALHIARKGVYDESALKNVSPEMRKKYFSRVEGGFELIKDIRRMVLFSRHDLTSNPPFLRIDLITCRNLLIYFDQDLQSHVMPMFHYALNPDGHLFLGKSESIGDFIDAFVTVDSKNKIYRKKEGASRISRMPYFRLLVNRKKAVKSASNSEVSVSEMVKETFYQSFEHPYIVVNEQLDLVEVNGEIGNLLSIKSGPVSSNAIKLIDKNLQIEFRAIMGKCIRGNKPVKGNIRRIKSGKDSRLVRINAQPLLFSKARDPLYLVIFEKIEINNDVTSTGQVAESESPRIIELEHEITILKEHMNTLVEELETFNEELQATNEELQSSNEELQASNEELETSNEELQSTNEELEIAYNELRTAAKEIERQNELIKRSENNLRTIFNNTLQGFVLIDKKYTIKTYNKVAVEIILNAYGKKLNIGESFINIITPEEFEDFHRNFKNALEGKLTQNTVFVPNDGQSGKIWLNYNYTPVHDENDEESIDYVNISFIDNTKQNVLIDEREHLLLKLKQQNEELQKINEVQEEFVHIIAHDLRSPLSNLKMAVHQFEDADPDEILELLPILNKSIDRLDNTINGLVKIIEIEGGHNEIEYDISLEEVWDDVQIYLKEKIRSRGAAISFEGVNGQKITYVRPFLMNIFSSLLSNAIKFVAQGEKPLISARMKKFSSGYELTIVDNGVGIDLEKYGSRLFMPFKRIAKYDESGMGVSLHIVKTMVEKNGGKIDVESEVGKGSTFRVFLKEYGKSD